MHHCWQRLRSKSVLTEVHWRSPFFRSLQIILTALFLFLSILSGLNPTCTTRSKIRPIKFSNLPVYNMSLWSEPGYSYGTLFNICYMLKKNLITLTASTSLVLKNSMFAKKIGDGILKTFTPSGSYIWGELFPLYIYIYISIATLLLKTFGWFWSSYKPHTRKLISVFPKCQTIPFTQCYRRHVNKIQLTSM